MLDNCGAVGHIIAPFSDSRKPQKPVIYTKNHSEEMEVIGHIRCSEIAVTVKTTVRAAYVTTLGVFFFMKLPFVLCNRSHTNVSKIRALAVLPAHSNY